MNRFFLTTTLIAVVFYASTRIAYANEKVTANNLIVDLKQAQTVEELEQTVDMLQSQRFELIKTLIRMIRNETDNELKIRVCYLLGEYRASEAAIDLVENITLEAKVPAHNLEPLRWNRYPAQEAIVKCGHRSIPYLLTKIESSDDELIQKLSIRSLWQILSVGLSQNEGKNYARIIIQNRLIQESNPEKKARLESALNLLTPRS